MSETGVHRTSNIFTSLNPSRIRTEKKRKKLSTINWHQSHLPKSEQKTKRKNLSMPPDLTLRSTIDFEGPLIPNKRLLKKAAKKIFNYFDFNKSKILGKCEIEIMDDLIKKSFGNCCRNKDNDYSKNYFMRLLDYDCDGRISFEDFETFFISRFSHVFETNVTETVKPMMKIRESTVLGDITQSFVREKSTRRLKETYYIEKEENSGDRGNVVESRVYVVKETVETTKQFKPRKSKVEFVPRIPRSASESERSSVAEVGKENIRESRVLFIEEEKEQFGDLNSQKVVEVKQEEENPKESYCEEVRLSKSMVVPEEEEQVVEKEEEKEEKREFFVAMNTISEEEESQFESFDDNNFASRISSTSSSSSCCSEEPEGDFLKKSTKVEFHYEDVINLPLQTTDSMVHSISQNNPFLLKRVEKQKHHSDEEHDEEDLSELQNYSPDSDKDQPRTEYNSFNNQFLMYKSIDVRYNSIQETIRQIEQAEASNESSNQKIGENRKIRELYSSRSQSRNQSRKNSLSRRNSPKQQQSVSKNTLKSKAVSNFSNVSFSVNSIQLPSSTTENSSHSKEKRGIENPVLSANKSTIRSQHLKKSTKSMAKTEKLEKNQNIQSSILNKSNSVNENIKTHFKEDIEREKIEKKLKSLEHSQQLSVIEDSVNEGSSFISDFDTSSNSKRSHNTLESAMSEIDKKYCKMRKIKKSNSKLSNEKETGRFGNSGGIEELKKQSTGSRRYKNSKKNSIHIARSSGLELSQSSLVKEIPDQETIESISMKRSNICSRIEVKNENEPENKTVEENLEKKKENTNEKVKKNVKDSIEDSLGLKSSQDTTTYEGRRINFYTKSMIHERGSQVEEIIDIEDKTPMVVSKVVEVNDIEDLRQITVPISQERKKICSKIPTQQENKAFKVIKAPYNSLSTGKEPMKGRHFKVKKVKITSIKSEQLYLNKNSSLHSSVTISSNSKRSSLNKALNKPTFESNENMEKQSESRFLRIERSNQKPRNLDSAGKKMNMMEISGKPNQSKTFVSEESEFTPKKVQLVKNMSSLRSKNSLQSTNNLVPCKESKVLVSHTFRHRPKPTSSFFVTKEQKEQEETESQKIGGRKKFLRKSDNLPSNTSILTNLTSNYQKSSRSVSKKKKKVFNREEEIPSCNTTQTGINYLQIDSKKNKSPLNFKKRKRESSKCEVFVLVEGTQILNERNQLQEVNHLRSRSKSDRNCSKISSILQKRIGGGRRDRDSLGTVDRGADTDQGSSYKGSQKSGRKRISMAKRLSRIK